jgi:hypothetical protein
MINRDSFDEPTVSAMDEIAQLLHMHKAVRGMNETFKNGNARGLDAAEAKPAATRVLKATRAAAAGLMKAAFSRELDFDVARERHLPRLVRALESAVDLSRQEREAYPEIGHRTVFLQHVELPLKAITARWSAKTRK